jgi:acyl-CoA reductase-like NAD-dependent aldehyde dehydrogenase
MSIQTVNPNTNKTVKSFEEMTDKTVDATVAKAHLVYAKWKETSYQQRANLLHKVAKLMRIKKSELAKTVTLEMGKLLSEAEGEIDLRADNIDYYADTAEDFLADKVLDPEYGEAIIRNSPIGTLLGVMPWNFPYYQVARFAAPNIMMGNTILLKHASIVPRCATAIGLDKTEVKLLPEAVTYSTICKKNNIKHIKIRFRHTVNFIKISMLTINIRIILIFDKDNKMPFVKPIYYYQSGTVPIYQTYLQVIVNTNKRAAFN